MKKTISRNIAIVSAIFIVAFSIMLITNYFQVSGADTIHSEVLEKLRQANEEAGNNPQLQQQIREMDLLARKAYFISLNRLISGAVILLVMVAVFVISLRIYFAKSKNIPDKEVDPIDDWMLKSKARTYIGWTTGGLVFVGLLFAVLTSPYLAPPSPPEGGNVATVSISENVPTTDLDLQSVPTDTTTIEASPVTSEGEKKDSAALTSPPLGGLGGAFRNNSLGISNAKNIPTSWNLASGKNILWKVKVPRKGYNSPVINGNKVFFTGADNEVRELFCYELSSGKELWRLVAQNIPGSPSQAPKTTEDTGLAAPTVATNGKQVCAIFGTGDVICADMNGKQLWAKNIGVPDNSYGYGSSLLIFGNTLIIQYDNRNARKVLALDLANGNQRWAKNRSERNPSWSSPIIATVNNKPQLILVGNPGITSYNPNNGEQNWRVEAMSGEPAPGPAYANGIVFAATEYATLIAINAADGSTLWKNSDYLPEVASPVATKDFVFVATSYGAVASFDAKTGELIKTIETEAEFYSSPIIVDGKIYLICTKGKVFIFSAKGDFNLINSFETGEKTFATPAFTDKKIVIRTEESVYCVSSE